MKIFYIFILVLPVTLFSQNEELEVFKFILDLETKNCIQRVYVQDEKERTYISKDFLNSFSNIPKESLLEIQMNTLLPIKNKHWNKTIKNKRNIYFIKEKKAKTLLKRKRQSIISISVPTFNSNFLYCIVSISHKNFHKSSSGLSYLLKKENNQWIIISTFDFWIT